MVALLDSNHACVRVVEVLVGEVCEESWKVGCKVSFQGAAFLVLLEDGGFDFDMASILDEEHTSLMLDLVGIKVVLIDPMIVVIDLVALKGAALDLEILVPAKSRIAVHRLSSLVVNSAL